MRALVCLGDKTTYGEVITATTTCYENGKPLAQSGDKARCDRCQGSFPIFGTAWDCLEQQPFVATGDRVLCECLDHFVYGSTTQYTAASPQPTYPASQTTVSQVGLPKQNPTAMPLTSTSPGTTWPINDDDLDEEEEEEELANLGIVLRLGLFFDGTGNNQANSAAAAGCHAEDVGLSIDAAEDIRQHCAALGYDGNGTTPDNSYGNNFTNVARLYDLYPDQAGEQLAEEAQEAYLKVYLEGVGTRSGLADSIYSQGTGRGATGVVARVEQMPALVMQQLEIFRRVNPGVKVRVIEFDLFGFSRGAAAARHCANDLLRGAYSLLGQLLPGGSPLLASGFKWHHRKDFALNFIGLFDTVAGIVSIRDGDFSPHNAKNPGLDLLLAPGMARKVVHLVAGNEYRHNFPLTQAGQDIVLPGCHSDLGGGYLPLTQEKLLLSKPDSSIEPAELPHERSAAFRRTRERFAAESPYWLTYVAAEGLDVATWASPPSQRTRDTPSQRRVYSAISSVRAVRGELALVYLRIMREFAVRANVAFGSIPATQAMSLPAELQPIAAKLQAYALGEAPDFLDAEETSMLRRRYIHLSAHWNAARGKHNSVLDVVFINRPANGMKRVEHPNA